MMGYSKLIGHYTLSTGLYPTLRQQLPRYGVYKRYTLLPPGICLHEAAIAIQHHVHRAVQRIHRPYWQALGGTISVGIARDHEVDICSSYTRTEIFRTQRLQNAELQ